jgi:protoporphyrinogen/coproporphyrinogen III oxidase
VRHKALIIGGGISGLSAAYYLNRSGIRPTLIERAPRLGGVIQTSMQQSCMLEEGPDGFMAAKPWAMNLIRDLGLTDQVIGSNDHSRVTYIVKNGELVPMPDGLMMMVPTKFLPLIETPLFSPGAKIRMALEYFRQPPQEPLPDRSVAEFLLDHYGQESLDYLAEPLLSGVYGGDPREMSVKSVLGRFVELETKYGSLTRGALAQPRPVNPGGSFLQTLKGGLGELIGALGTSADVFHGDAETIELEGDRFLIRANGDWLEADQVVVALPACDASPVLRSVEPELAGHLSEIPYSSSITLSLGYRRSTFDHPLVGHGFLVPKKERRHIFGCTWVNNKFDHRAPDNLVVLRCFLGGEALTLPDDKLLDAARSDLSRYMHLKAEPVFHNVARWPNAMAQYTVGHEQRVKRIEDLVSRRPGLYLAGNAYHGIGIPDCVRMGHEAAAKIIAGCKRALQTA